MKKTLAIIVTAALFLAAVPALAAEPDDTEALLNYIWIENDTVNEDATQNIVISIDGVDANMTLSYHDDNGNTYTAQASAYANGAALFALSDKEGHYTLDFVTTDGGVVVFSDTGIDDAGFDVIEAVDEGPGIVSYSAVQDGTDLIEDAIGAIDEQIPMAMAATESSNVTVVLDPGHDSTHTGAQYDGLSEENLNLKIAQYCKNELEQYNGVTVYMTRTTASCPYPGSSNSNDLANRVNYASSVGASVYVALHLNANSNTSVSGSQVYCPNTNYNKTISAEGFGLAEYIMEQLNALGLSNRGIYSVNSQTGTTYPDGSLADYYAVIRRSKLAGFPGIIVEHAFMSNSSDLNTHLTSEAQLKRLGVADATGIANYYGLSKVNTDIEKINGTWTYTVDSTPDYSFTGVAKNANGWWYVKNGIVDFSYTGFAPNQYGKWYCENGKVTFKKQGILKDKTGAIGETGAWYYVIGSQVQTGFTGLSNFSNENGWWYIRNGKVDFTHNGVDKNVNGWFYVTGGKVRFGFTGLANHKNTYGWWYIKNGKVDFAHNGVDKNKNGWCYITGGKVRTGFTGLANHRNKNGWWYIRSGKVDFNHNGVDKNKNGWFYIKSGKVQFNFTGLSDYKNVYGWWYIRNGKVDFSYTGKGVNKYGTWNVVNGKVIF